ncbi:MAG TPA: hypothetical protein VI279_11940 [Rhodocyclaceae bacterium]
MERPELILAQLRHTPALLAYLVAWLAACVVAVALLVRRPQRFSLLSMPYLRFLAQPWKLATFVAATISLTVVAPWSGDPTWDYTDALFMSVLTFATAPWSVGVLYRTARGREALAVAYVAACLWLFSASWSYDFYLILRDGGYPVTWRENIAASSILYLLAGLMWNLDWPAGHGGRLAFTAADWPPAASSSSWRLLAMVALIMLLVAALMAPFWWRW